MGFKLQTLTDLRQTRFDDIIDVRSPSEFAEDHIPGAVNLPVLDDAERARVGTIYVQESRLRARRVGAALVARNAARHLEGYLVHKGPRYRPLVHCWRGGQRSEAFASILGQIGWRVEVLVDGYRAYRRQVSALLYEAPFPVQLVLLDGNTGTAKTDILAALARRGVQVIDLEGMAHHRGSLFGARPGGQPTQKGFESALAAQVVRLDPSRPVMVEAESSRIGAVMIPPGLWRAMHRAPRIALVAPTDERAAYLSRAYADMTKDRAAFSVLIDRLRPYHAAERVAEWHALAVAGEMTALARELIVDHYDPRYARSTARQAAPAAVVELGHLDPADIDAAAGRLEAALGSLAPPKGKAVTV